MTIHQQGVGRIKGRIHIICGHYGCGKTNLALNLALSLRSQRETVTVADLDIVNPYFRTADFKEVLEKKGIRVISPHSAGTTIDAPQINAEIFSIFDRPEGHVVIDVGGDDAGAAALGRFKRQIEAAGGCEMLYVVNHYRKLVETSEEAVSLLREVEAASRLKASGIVNNSHLSSLTTPDDILAALPYAQEAAREAGLPLVMTTAPRALCGDLAGKVENLYPVDILVQPPWAENK